MRSRRERGASGRKRPRGKCAARSFCPCIHRRRARQKKRLRALFLRLFVDGEKRYAFRLGSARRFIVPVCPEQSLNLNSVKSDGMVYTLSLTVLYNGSPRSSNRVLPLDDRAVDSSGRIAARRKNGRRAFARRPLNGAFTAALFSRRRRSGLQNRRPASVWRRYSPAPNRSRSSLKRRLDRPVRRLPIRSPYRALWPWRQYFE